MNIKDYKKALGQRKLPGEVISELRPLLLHRAQWRPGQEQGWDVRLMAGILEARKGYRFRPEDVALPWLLRDLKANTVVDLGAGSGSLLVGAICATGAARAVGVEIQPEAAERLERTLEALEMSPGAKVLCGDLRSPALTAQVMEHLQGQAQLVVCNPPFFPAQWGRPSAQESTRLSTHAEHGGVEVFVKTAAAMLAPEGSVWVVYDAGRMVEVMMAAQQAKLCVQHLYWLPDTRPGKEAQAFRVWVKLGHTTGAGVSYLGPPQGKIS